MRIFPVACFCFASTTLALAACGGTGGGSGIGDTGGSGTGGTTTSKGGASGATGKGGAAGKGGSGGSGQAGTSMVVGGGGSAQAGNGAAGATGGTGPSAGGMGSGGDPNVFGAGGGAGIGAGGGLGCQSSGNMDQDKDGFTVAQGDCNDCDPNINPGAVDVLQKDAMGNPLPASMQVDSNCDTMVANAAEFVCDDALAIDDKDPFDGAKAIELCQKQTGASWGVIQASYVQFDGKPLPSGNGDLGHGLLSAFGPTVSPKAGKRMLALSSGTARQPNDPGYQDVSGFDKGFTCGTTPGFPIESPACPGVTTGQPHDSVALKVQIKVPTNAKSFTFNFKFYTYEFPGFICSQYNDFFTVLMDPAPMDVNQTNKNITFDSMKNAVSVNNAFLDVCTAQSAGGKTFPCAAGPAGLQGTGFEGHAATSWLTTQANVTPGGTVWLEFAAFDSGDGVLDSTGIVDNFAWSATPGMGTSTHK
jgi:hypothetical protein